MKLYAKRLMTVTLISAHDNIGGHNTNRTNQDKSAANFVCKVAAWVPDMFCNFYLVNNYKIAKNSTTTEAKEKISADLESLEVNNLC
jgi:hypothetical protein